MKNKKVVFWILLISCMLLGNNNVSILNAHSNKIDFGDNDCVRKDYIDSDDIGNGVSECWFVLEDKYNMEIHISHNVDTIKYYFMDSKDGVSWTSHITQSQANTLIDSTISSFEKWNNVYFYRYLSNGSVEKKKLINIEEGTLEDHNVSVFPYIHNDQYGKLEPSEEYEWSQVEANHKHYSHFNIYINVDIFNYENPNGLVTSQEDLQTALERTGAHEMGHVLGLKDVDKYCSSASTHKYYHHQEILMGYSREKEALTGQKNITYKDIAGVAINRGFHTSSDHKFNFYQASDNDFYLICSICNYKTTTSFSSSYLYPHINRCNSNHLLNSNNLFAVASYENYDYVKCKYCSYVALFEDNVYQNYIYEDYSDTQHKIINNVTGLEYFQLENHNFIGGYCSECNHHKHAIVYNYFNNFSHKGTCRFCKQTLTKPHVVLEIDILDNDGYATCLECNKLLDMSRDSAIIGGILSVSDKKYSTNGSYISENGIIVLNYRDVEAYLNGTLVFNDNLLI